MSQIFSVTHGEYNLLNFNSIMSLLKVISLADCIKLLAWVGRPCINYRWGLNSFISL